MTIKFNPSDFLKLGLHLEQSEWTKAEIDALAASEAECVINLSHLTTLLQIPASEVVLTTYKGRDSAPGFSVPTVLLDKDGDLCISVGRHQITLQWNGDQWECSQGLKFDAEPYIRDDNSIPVILFKSQTKMQQGKLKQTVDISLLLQTLKDADKADIAEKIQNGTLPTEGITQIGKGSGGLKISRKIWTLPKGLYRLSQATSKTINGKNGPVPLFEGTATNIESSASYLVKMSGKPFSPSINKMAVAGTPIYIYVDGAIKYDVGIGANAYAMAIKGEFTDSVKSSFMELAKNDCATTARKNSHAVMNQADWESSVADYVTTEEAKIQAWIDKKGESAQNSTVPAPTAKKEEPTFDEIPF